MREDKTTELEKIIQENKYIDEIKELLKDTIEQIEEKMNLPEAPGDPLTRQLFTTRLTTSLKIVVDTLTNLAPKIPEDHIRILILMFSAYIAGGPSEIEKCRMLLTLGGELNAKQ